MGDFLGIAFNVISPIFMVIGISYIVGRSLNPDPRALSVFLIYVLVPTLTFKGIRETQLSPQELGGMALMVLGITASMIIIGLVVVRFMKWENQLAGGFMITLFMINSANYGIPVNTFAFGEEGGKVAIVYYALNTVAASILGVYFASGGNANPRQAINNMVRVPLIYAVFVGLAFNFGKFSLPLPLERAVDITASGAIPTMLALLGLQLARTKAFTGKLRPVLIGTVIRLILSPLIAVPIALLLGLTGITFSVAVLQSSMPTAILANALASEFGSDTEYTAMMTLVSTLASVVTLSIVLLALGVRA